MIGRQPARLRGFAATSRLAEALAEAAIAVAALLLVLSPRVSAQQSPATPRAAAPLDLTGVWVSVVTEDWRWRMRTPPKGDYASVPLNAAGRKVADSWDPATDAAAGESCRPYGAPGVMRIPGRIRIAWENDSTLRIDTEAGTQTRLLRFGPPQSAAAEPTWQGQSVAEWEIAGGRERPTGGSLKVVTTRLRPGYLRLNGVPYSADTILTEHFNRTIEDNGDSWLFVTTIVQDPRYLTGRFVTSTHYKKLPDGAAWKPVACAAS